ncbi:RNA polymerase sigma-70 factor [Sphingobacterium sp. lm-10]|uniref:RNA polymerase sigma-70 factor n=1 Tax=Sphingobacterium sp. lm-10 TaxID=2944904 RepID=UPI00201FB93F|nr:RNA polymerase sigma-70 factor [Sphingobacterium sp. lm-10]MCL7989170.1 RNA polymerase sigma-70 factor [Sphingobacterium sp. lm-10]
MLLDEKELLSAFRNGDESAFAMLYDQYWEHLYLHAFRILKDRHATEDVIQDVFISLWKKHKTLKIRNLNNYLYQATRYQVFRYLRRKGYTEPLTAELEFCLTTDDLQSAIQENELRTWIDREVDKLPPKCREIFLLSRHQLLNNREISSRLAISVKTVENQMTIALRRLRQLYQRLSLYLLFLIFF